MSDTPQPQPPAPGPKPSGLKRAARAPAERATSGQWFLPWWFPGLALGLIAAVGTLAAVMIRPTVQGTHKAEALVQLRPKFNALADKAPDDFAEYRNRQIFLLRSRDLITGVLKEPAVASLDSVKAAMRPGNDPVQMIEERLQVTEAAPDVLAVGMIGNDPADMKVILDHLVKRYVDDATAYERMTLDTQIKKNEQYAESLRIEIEALEKQIELLQKANGVTNEENATRLAVLQKRHIETDVEFGRVGREIGKLEAELTVLKKQLNDKSPKEPPDPVLVEDAVKRDPRVIKAKAALDAVVEAKTEIVKARKEYDEARRVVTAEAVEVARALELTTKKRHIADLETQTEIKKEERERLRTERDALKKLIDQGVVGGSNIEAMRQALKPQKDTLDKLNTLLAQLRVERAMDARVSMRGEVTVERVPGPERTSLVLWPGVAFASGFVLATVFSLVGLLFRVLRRAA